MLTAELRSQVDKVWNSFWSGGISNPLEIIEQITYLLFLRRLDDLQTLEEQLFLKLQSNSTWQKFHYNVLHYLIQSSMNDVAKAECTLAANL